MSFKLLTPVSISAESIPELCANEISVDSLSPNIIHFDLSILVGSTPEDRATKSNASGFGFPHTYAFTPVAYSMAFTVTPVTGINRLNTLSPITVCAASCMSSLHAINLHPF